MRQREWEIKRVRDKEGEGHRRCKIYTMGTLKNNQLIFKICQIKELEINYMKNIMYYWGIAYGSIFKKQNSATAQ